MQMKKILLSILLCLGGGWLSGWLTESGKQNWYVDLVKPTGTPPGFVFPIVWTILYICMGIALGLLWDSEKDNKLKASIYFFIQLGLNFAWSWFFFGIHAIGLALIDISLLWIFVLMTIITIWPHTALGGRLLLPYLFWISYAFYLNLSIWILNGFVA